MNRREPSLPLEHWSDLQALSAPFGVGGLDLVTVNSRDERAFVICGAASQVAVRWGVDGLELERLRVSIGSNPNEPEQYFEFAAMPRELNRELSELIRRYAGRNVDLVDGIAYVLEWFNNRAGAGSPYEPQMLKPVQSTSSLVGDFRISTNWESSTFSQVMRGEFDQTVVVEPTSARSEIDRSLSFRLRGQRDSHTLSIDFRCNGGLRREFLERTSCGARSMLSTFADDLVDAIVSLGAPHVEALLAVAPTLSGSYTERRELIDEVVSKNRDFILDSGARIFGRPDGRFVTFQLAPTSSEQRSRLEIRADLALCSDDTVRSIESLFSRSESNGAGRVARELAVVLSDPTTERVETGREYPNPFARRYVEEMQRSGSASFELLCGRLQPETAIALLAQGLESVVITATQCDRSMVVFVDELGTRIDAVILDSTSEKTRWYRNCIVGASFGERLENARILGEAFRSDSDRFEAIVAEGRPQTRLSTSYNERT